MSDLEQRVRTAGQGQGVLPVLPHLTLSPAALGKPACRLGLASRGDSGLRRDDVLHAIDAGVNFLNWPGEADSPGGRDAVSDAVAALGDRRESLVVCVQFGARTDREAAAELRSILAAIQSDYVDVVTLYYVESPAEWRALSGPGGALEYLRGAQGDGRVRRIGVTSHQRPLAAAMARSGLLDALMVRYNAAHRGAEREVFPATAELGLPVIAYTALRWGALLRATPDDPPGFDVPAAPAWYRFVLQNPAVSIVLMAPNDRAELEQDLEVLRSPGPLGPAEYARLVEHGDRVRRHAGRFP